MRKIIALLLTFLAVCIFFGGCSRDALPQNTDDPVADQQSTEVPAVKETSKSDYHENEGTTYYGGESIESAIYKCCAILLAKFKGHEPTESKASPNQPCDLLHFDVVDLIQGVYAEPTIDIFASSNFVAFEDKDDGENGVYRKDHLYVLIIRKEYSLFKDAPRYGIQYYTYIPVNDDGTITEVALSGRGQKLDKQFANLDEIKDYIFTIIPESYRYKSIYISGVDHLYDGTMDEIVAYGQYIVKATVTRKQERGGDDRCELVYIDVSETYKEEGVVKLESGIWFPTYINDCEVGKEYYFILGRSLDSREQLYGLSSKKGAIIPADDEEKVAELMAILNK